LPKKYPALIRGIRDC